MPIVGSHLGMTSSLGNHSNIRQPCSSFKETLSYVPSFASTLPVVNHDRSSSPSCNSHLRHSSHNPSSQPSSFESSLQPVSSRYIRQSSDSTSQSESLSDEDDEGDADDDCEQNLGGNPSLTSSASGKEVQIIDAQGNVKKEKEFKSKDIYALKKGERVVVEVNEVGQPIGDSRGALSRWMTSLLNEPNLCPIDAKDFKEVKDNYITELLRVLRIHFLIPSRIEVDKTLTKLFGDKFRNLRHKRNAELFKKIDGSLRSKMKEVLQAVGVCGEELENMIKSRQFGVEEIEEELDIMTAPKEFNNVQWTKYKNYFKSDEYKKFSQTGKEARSQKNHMHTTGSTSFAQRRAKFEKDNGRQAGYVELFDITYKKKDGSFVEPEITNFMTKANSMMEALKSTGKTPQEIDNKIWKELMGEDTPGVALGYGAGVTKSQVKRLRSSSVGSENAYLDPRVQSLENMVHEQQKMLTDMMHIVADLQRQLQSTQLMLRNCGCGRNVTPGPISLVKYLLVKFIDHSFPIN